MQIWFGVRTPCKYLDTVVPSIFRIPKRFKQAKAKMKTKEASDSFAADKSYMNAISESPKEVQRRFSSSIVLNHRHYYCSSFIIYQFISSDSYFHLTSGQRLRCSINRDS